MKLETEKETDKVILKLAKGLNLDFPKIMLKAIGLYGILFDNDVMTNPKRKLYIYDEDTQETIEVCNI